MDTSGIDFKVLAEHLPVGVFRFNAGKHARCIFANARACSMLGISLDLLLKTEVADLFVDKKDYESFVRRLKSANGTIRAFEAYLNGSGAKTVFCSLSVSKMKKAKSRDIYYDVVCEDISGRKELEKGLSESKKLFQAVFNNTAAAIIVTDIKGRIFAWNPHVEKVLHFTKEDLFNMPAKDLYPKKAWSRINSKLKANSDAVSNIETKIYQADGSILDVEISISVLRDSNNKAVGSIGIIRDITRQKDVERKIKESENKIRIILDNSAAAIMLTDENERIISWNKYTEHLLGMNRKDLYCKPVSFLYPKEEWQKIRSENIRKTGSKHHLETKVIAKSGVRIDIDLSINVLKDTNNDIVGSVGIMQDITEQKKVQEILLQAKQAAEQANNAKSMFLANMSHEVRTPMNTILGMIDLTVETSLTDEQKDNLLVAKDAANSLLSLLNDILDLSRVEAGKITLEEIEFNLHNILKNVIKGLDVISKGKNVNLVLEIDEGVPDVLVGDPVRLRQVLINLINNAIKFTHKGHVLTRVKVDSTTKNRVMLLFSVIDEGIGIPKKRHKQIFETFTQADDSTTRRFGGTGLGLAISKKLVELMGGRIWVESEEAKGSEFNFTCDLQVVKGARVKEFNKQASSVTPLNTEEMLQELTGLKILLAEDNLVNQKITVRMLEKWGMKIDVVDNGKTALSMLEKNNYDLILMDANMPVLDGLETTKIIRANEKKTGTYIPIIALTARAMQEDKKEFIDMGMDGYVTKPIDQKGLINEIAKFFNKGK